MHPTCSGASGCSVPRAPKPQQGWAGQGRAGQGLPSQLAAGVCASDSLGWCQLGWLRAEEGVRTAPVGQRGALRGQRQGKAAGDWGEAMDVVLTTIHTLARLLLQTDVLGTPPSTLESTLKGGVVVFLHP